MRATTTGSVTSASMTEAIKAISAIDRGLAKEWRKEAKTKITTPWARELAAQAPSGWKGAAAARSIQPGTGAKPVIWAGKGTTNEGTGGPWQPFFALEYGMSHDNVHRYVRRNRSGAGRHLVNRRVGRWAPEHRGASGNWFWPYWEANQDRLRDQVIDLADDFIRRAL